MKDFKTILQPFFVACFFTDSGSQLFNGNRLPGNDRLKVVNARVDAFKTRLRLGHGLPHLGYRVLDQLETL